MPLFGGHNRHYLYLCVVARSCCFITILCFPSALIEKKRVSESLKVTSRNAFCNTAAYHYWCHFIFHWPCNWSKTGCQIGCSVHVCVSYVIKIKLVEMYVSLACILLIDTELPLKVYFMCICACMFSALTSVPYFFRNPPLKGLGSA